MQNNFIEQADPTNIIVFYVLNGKNNVKISRDIYFNPSWHISLKIIGQNVF